MIHKAALPLLVFLISVSGMRIEAQRKAQVCPIIVEQMILTFNHHGGQSSPELQLRFGNATQLQIAAVTFSLSLLDSGGYPRPYPESLSYSDGLEAGKKQSFTWSLASESVDMKRTGETIVVERVDFENQKAWKDDGSQSCAFSVDFHPR